MIPSSVEPMRSTASTLEPRGERWEDPSAALSRITPGRTIVLASMRPPRPRKGRRLFVPGRGRHGEVQSGCQRLRRKGEEGRRTADTSDVGQVTVKRDASGGVLRLNAR